MMQVTKVWWDGERLMAEPIDPTTIYQEPAQKPQRWAVFCQGCRKEWSVSYPHPGKDICVDCDDKLAQQDSTCSNTLRAQGKAYPRTCKKCGLGPCVELAQQALDKMAENARELGLDYEPVCNKDPQGCWNVRCQLGKKCKNTQAQRTWVGLTDEDWKQLYDEFAMGQELDEFAEAIEAKLKEKNNG